MSEKNQKGLLDENNVAIPSVGFFLVDGTSVSEEEYNARQEAYQGAVIQNINVVRTALVKAFEDKKEPEDEEGELDQR